MQTILEWPEITLRLGLTLVAGIIIGINRGENGGRPAGLRTTVLVCLTASSSMVLANLLLGTTGKAWNSYVNVDVMRLPLGVLTGIGFIGAGAIIHKGDLIKGVTTAATMWFVTLMGFCFGAGEIGLGLALLGLGVFVLWGLKWVEKNWRRRQEATVAISILPTGPSQDEIMKLITETGHEVFLLGVEFSPNRRTLRCNVYWNGRPRRSDPPGYLGVLEKTPGVEKVKWKQMVST